MWILIMKVSSIRDWIQGQNLIEKGKSQTDPEKYFPVKPRQVSNNITVETELCSSRRLLHNSVSTVIRVGKSSRLTVWLEIFWRVNRKPQTIKNLILRFETKIAKNLGKLDHFSSQFYVYWKLFYILSLQRYFNSKITFKKLVLFAHSTKYPNRKVLSAIFSNGNRKP